jgi:hypothetical protein
MTVVFPKNNLPEPAQPWAREVQKQLANVIASDRANEINNAARDNQLNSSLITLTKTVSDVKVASIQASDAAAQASDAAAEASDAINGLIGLGSTGSDYTLNASNIVGGTITGVTIRSGTSGQRVIISSSTIDFYTSANNFGGSIFGGGTQGVIISSQDANSTVTLTNGGADLFKINGGYVGVSSDGVTIGANSKRTFMQDPQIEMPFITTSTAAANTRWGTATNGRIFYISSARRAKYDIQDAEVNLEALNLRPRTWFDMNEYIENGNSTEGLTRIPGFVAEEVLEAGLEEFVTYDQDGIIQGLSYDRMVASIVPVIKHHQDKIIELTTRIEILENGAN